jgi:Sulfotransferase family
MKPSALDAPAEAFTGPLFVVGMPRSGTKLLRELLTRHEKIRIPRTETEFFPELQGYVARQGGDMSERARFNRMYHWCQRFPYFRYAKRRGELIAAEKWYATCREWGAAGVFEALMRHDADAPFDSDRIWGDKSPSYVRSIQQLAEQFPRARFVHIVRDVRDQVLSSREAWGKDMLRAAQRWTDDVGEGMSAGRALGGRYTWLRYEDLTAEPKAALRRLCDFLGVEFHHSMLELDRAPENLGAARHVRGIVSNNSGKFRDRLTPRQLAAIESIAGVRAEELGYRMTAPRHPRRLSGLSLFWRQGKDAATLIARRSRSLGFKESALFHYRYRQATSGRSRGRS